MPGFSWSIKPPLLCLNLIYRSIQVNRGCAMVNVRTGQHGLHCKQVSASGIIYVPPVYAHEWRALRCTLDLLLVSEHLMDFFIVRVSGRWVKYCEYSGPRMTGISRPGTLFILACFVSRRRKLLGWYWDCRKHVDC